MSTPSPFNEKGNARRLLVTLFITTAAAAVTAGVALKERHSGDVVVRRAESTPTVAGGSADAAPPVVTRRERWRDPWKRPAPGSESASTSLHERIDAGGTVTDLSLPQAAEALESGAGASGDPAPTF
jgi:hypothetical protein